MFNISVLIAVYILLKVIKWEDIYYYPYLNDVGIATDAITFLTFIILFTDEGLKSSKYSKE